MIKGIIFDMGGVILDINLDRCARCFREDAGMETIGEILDPCHQKGIIGDMEGGKISEQEFYDMARPLCRPGTTDEVIRNCMLSILDEIHPEKLEFLSRLKEKYDLYILSNNNPIVINYLEPAFEKKGLPLKDTFKKCFYSYRMKMLKPSEEIFKKAIEETGLPPEELLFIDDAPKNVEAARRCGLNAEQHIYSASLEETVSKGLKNTSSPA